MSQTTIGTAAARGWSGLTLEEKVGQLFMIGFTGTEPGPDLKRLLVERHVGGVILFFRNIRDGAHLADLTAAIRELAPRPLLVAADQEGGSVLRVRSGATLLPSPMGLARLGPEAVRDVARICGEEMRAMGLNLNLAPVLDVNRPENPGVGMRSFGEDPDRVARMARAYVEGLQSTGALACAKHFPGKGAARLDAHLDLPVIERGAEELAAGDLVPFRVAFAAGAAAAMTSHCLYRGLDDRPATLSKRILTGLLRDELGFEGILITDDMEMGAIRRYHEGTAAAVAAFAAGADVILICHDHAAQEASLLAVAHAVRSGTVPESRLDESLARIRRAKERVGPAPAEDIGSLHRRNAPRVQAHCDRIVQVWRDPERLLPLAGGAAIDVYWPNMSVLTNVEEGEEGGRTVCDAFASRFADVRLVPYDPRDGSVAPAHARPPGAPAAVFFSANAHLYPAQAKLVAHVRAIAHPFVLVSLRNPYDRDLVPAGDTVVCGFGFLGNALSSVLATLLGSGRPG
jgi:beta-N-acetylhexosaminidase